MTYVVQKCFGIAEMMSNSINANNALFFEFMLEEHILLLLLLPLCAIHILHKYTQQKSKKGTEREEDVGIHQYTHLDLMHAICKCARIILIPMG